MTDKELLYVIVEGTLENINERVSEFIYKDYWPSGDASILINQDGSSRVFQPVTKNKPLPLNP